MHVSPLEDRHGRELGRLLLLHDVTEERAAQGRLLEQERALAVLREREHLARELHDTVGQVLGYVSMQAQTAGKKVADGDVEAAALLLARLTDVAQHAHADVRESILALSAAPSGGWSFLPALRRYLDEVRADYAVQTELCAPPDMADDPVEPEVAVQVLRVVQEAVTNVRRHAGGSAVRVTVAQDDGTLRVTVADDGRGFTLAPADDGRNGHFGLAFMRERMQEVGGSVDIVSQPGRGTSVSLAVGVASGGGGRSMRVLLADDHTLLLEGLQNLLEAHGIEVAGTARNGREAAEQARRLRPDVVLMDIRMPEWDGLTATRVIKAELPEVKVIMLTTSSESEDLFEAVKSGATGYLLKSMDAESLIDALHDAEQDVPPFAPGLAARLLAQFAAAGGSLPAAPAPSAEPATRPAPPAPSARRRRDLPLRPARSRSATASSRCSPWWRRASRTPRSARASA